jgi:predicted DNA-binding transcriptional regulator AlpA
MDRKYMNLDELKEFLGVNHQTIYNFRRLWGLPYIKIGSVVRYDRDEIIAWMARYRHVDSTEAEALPATGTD